MAAGVLHRTGRLGRKLVTQLGPRGHRIARSAVPTSWARWYRHRMTDAYVVSFPKAGRTWVRLMIGRALQLHYGLSDDEPVLELETLADKHPQLPRVVFWHDDNPQWKAPEDLAADKSQYAQKRVVLLVRDPRDVIVSLYHQVSRRRERYEGTMADFIRARRGGFETLLRFYEIWERAGEELPNFLLVRYEDLRGDPAGELRRVFDFLGLHAVSDDAVRDAVAYASFDNMRRLEQGDSLGSARLRAKDRSDPNSFKTRRGKVGGFADELTPSDVEYLNDRLSGCQTPLFGYVRTPEPPRAPGQPHQAT